MSSVLDAINKAVETIRSKTDLVPDVAIILGTGLGGLVKDISIETEIPYETILGFPISTVENHAGKLILGTLGRKKAVVMQGRFHMYEGYTTQEIAFPVRVLKGLGTDKLIISNVSGGLNPDFSKGDIMILKDHINLLGANPLIGKNENALGPRFPDMSQPYNRELIALAEDIAAQENISVRQGVYASMTGPSLETAAEYRMLQIIGADAIGMSTVPEVIAGVHLGLKMLALSVITDLCDPDALEPVNIQEIIKIAGIAEPKLTALIRRVIEKL